MVGQKQAAANGQQSAVVDEKQAAADGQQSAVVDQKQAAANGQLVYSSCSSCSHLGNIRRSPAGR